MEVDFRYPDKIEQKTRFFPICPESELVDISQFTEYMKNRIPHIYKSVKIVICDQTVKNDYLFYYEDLEFYVIYEMEVKKLKRVI